MILRVLMENHTENPSLIAEHGLSLYIEACGKRILFDAGQTKAFAENAEKLGIDLSAVDLAILSHGHYDHSGGLTHFLEINRHAPVYMHRRASEPHYNGTEKYIGIDPALAHHPRIVCTDDTLTLGNGLKLCTCNAQITDCPASARGMTVLRGETHVQDSFEYEQYLIIEENGRRIVISGCSHKGILNIVRWLTPDVLIGGFHFMKLDPEGADRAYLESAAASLLAQDCTYYTGHCTGEAPYAFLKGLMGDHLQSIHTGTLIEL